MRGEDKWTREILQPKLEKELGKGYVAACGKSLLYNLNISSYSIDEEETTLNLNSSKHSRGNGGYETDLLIYKQINEKEFIPLCVCEVKIEGMTSHDMITYNHKAGEHKILHKYLQYGVVVAKHKKSALNMSKLVNHKCENFDFVCCFKDYIPTEDEWKVFVKIIKGKIKDAEKLYTLLSNGTRDDFTYYNKSIEIK